MRNYILHIPTMFQVSSCHGFVRWSSEYRYSKSAHFCMFFAQKSAILNFFKNSKKMVLRNYILLVHTKFQVSSCYGLVRRPELGKPHFCMFFAQMSAILNFFKNPKKTCGRITNAQLWPKLQISSTFGLCCRPVHTRTDGQTTGYPISPFSWGIIMKQEPENQFC